MRFTYTGKGDDFVKDRPSRIRDSNQKEQKNRFWQFITSIVITNEKQKTQNFKALFDYTCR